MQSGQAVAYVRMEGGEVVITVTDTAKEKLQEILDGHAATAMVRIYVSGVG